MNPMLLRFGLSLVVLWTLPATGEGLKIGTAAVNINAPIGTPMAGYYRERACTGVADDLFAKAVVLDDGSTKAALVVCDLISLPRSTVLEARRLVAESTGIPGTNVMLSATHSHTGPVLARDSALDDVTGAHNTLCRDYIRRLPQLIAESVQQAHTRRSAASVSTAKQQEAELAFNRRFWMKDGSVGWNPGKSNPKIMRPAGPIDPDVCVTYFESPQRKPLLTLVNFSMHPDTTGGTLLSADYPGALSRRVAEYKGHDMLTIFANGACGNINHVNVNWASAQTSTNEANRLGTILAGSVFKAYMKLQPVAGNRLHVRSQILELPLFPAAEADLIHAREVQGRGEMAAFMERVEAYKHLDVESRKGKPFEVEVQVITLGRHLAWVSMPGEFFVEPGLNIKAASPFPFTQIVELANGSIGYIPNRSAYAEGDYEVLSARCASGSAEMLTTAAITLLEQIYKVP